jgi:DNA-directed RNA polymerase subunit alpha|uniref:DNA-directed RNA polymerase subunit alpha n=1 Tax=Florenciella parvula TaxID=236787 RepID=A0A516ZA05_9STRA|nr:RNA polymerase alpha subunit [Florenciella parvula]QDR24538.1 RNA polymerase alpha subunit [Florenciella parvula]|tara:strand:+ start:9964 stop:10902 length:939 start_codon:yes stop_codon:yes gene_type:complete
MAELNFQYFKSSVEESGKLTGHFLLQSLEAGQGLTIGNALRRVLLSNLEGTAITGIKIPGVAHEFSTIPNVREDVLEIFLNLKQIVLKSEKQTPIFGTVSINGPGVITASSIKFDDEDIEIVNPNQYIATFSGNDTLTFDLKVEKGIGYQFAEQANNNDNIDFLAIDAVFMPVLKVNYKINNVYLGYSKTTESLILEVTTNGSVSPEKALSEAAQKLMTWFSCLTSEQSLAPQKEMEVEPLAQNDVILIEELQLPVRAYNCLKRAGINSVDDLVNYSQEEIREIKNFGKKSAQEVFQALKDKFDIVLPSLNS